MRVVLKTQENIKWLFVLPQELIMSLMRHIYVIFIDMSNLHVFKHCIARTCYIVCPAIILLTKTIHMTGINMQVLGRSLMRHIYRKDLHLPNWMRRITSNSMIGIRTARAVFHLVTILSFVAHVAKLSYMHKTCFSIACSWTLIWKFSFF